VGSFVVAPDPWVLAYVVVLVVGGVVTAAKGRWGWMLVGVLLGGVIWPLTALLPAAPTSIWRRAFSSSS
jgi:hypothetical protein